MLNALTPSPNRKLLRCPPTTAPASSAGSIRPRPFPSNFATRPAIRPNVNHSRVSQSHSARESPGTYRLIDGFQEHPPRERFGEVILGPELFRFLTDGRLIMGRDEDGRRCLAGKG